MIIRKLEETDKLLMAEWTANDPDHKNYPLDWIFVDDRCERMVFQDDTGPILGFRISKALRLDVQFDSQQSIRTARALVPGFTWLIESARKAGFTQVIFESKSKPLIRFCKRRFAFKESPHEFIAFL